MERCEIFDAIKTVTSLRFVKKILSNFKSELVVINVLKLNFQY